MSKDFFAIIGDELCSIKNSPFFRIGQSNLNESSISNNNSNIRNESSQGLSYNPDRLFDPQKYKNSENLSKDYIEFKKSEEQQIQRIQITMLKQTANQEHRKHLQKAKNLQKQDFHHPFSIFKVYRSVCSLCNKCQQYNGNFNINSSGNAHFLNNKNVQFMQCNICSCPMNSHFPMNQTNNFTDQIFAHLSKVSLNQHFFSTKMIPLCFVKHQNVSIHTIMNNLYNYLPQLGFSMMSTRILSKNKFQLFQIKNQVLEGNQKQTIEKILKVIEYLQNDQTWNWEKQLADESYRQNFQIIKKLKKKIKLKKKLQEFDQVIVCLVKNQSHLDFFQIENIFKMHENKILSDSSLLWLPHQIKNCFTSSCLIFPEYFQLNHQIFILPSQKTKEQYQKVSNRFKDLLDYNQYTIIGQIKQIERQNLQKILKWQNVNKVNYILGQQMLNKSIRRAGIFMSAKIGPSVFTIPFKNAVDFIQISSAQKKGPFMMAFPQYLISQRCILILRPCFSLSNCQEILMTLLRINKFVVLKRIKLKFSQAQAKYLAVLQHIQQNQMKSYVDFMVSGLCEMILVSKRGAIYEANIIANGCQDGLSSTKTKTFKQNLTIQVRRGNQIYDYEPIIRPVEDNNLAPFKSMKDLFKVEKVLFPLDQRQYSKIHTNVRNGQIVKIQPQKQLHKQLKVSGKIKQAILTQIKHDRFNYWMFSSKSDSITQQLAGLFMPQTTLFQSVVVLIKPGYTHLADKIKIALNQHRYHLIMDKTVILSKNLATQLVVNLQKIKLDRANLKEIIQNYSGQKIHILCISKIYAKQEMFSMLSDFNFLPKKNIIIQDYIDDNNLKEVLIPVWNNPQFCLKILSEPLYSVEEAMLSLDAPNLSQKHKFQILNYLIGSYYGVSISDLSLQSRIGKFSYYVSNLISAKLQSWYYSQLSMSTSKYIPLLFQYRPIGESQNCLVIQSQCGLPFLTLIFNQYNEQLQKLKEATSNKQQRKSLVLFLWGKKLAQFVRQIGSKQISMEGWGRLQKKNQQWRGHFEVKQKKQQQRSFLKYCYQKFEENAPQIANNIKKMLDSRIPQQKYKFSNKRLLPCFPPSHIDQCIRIVETDLVSKLSLVDKFKMIDPLNEKAQQKNLYTFNLYNIEPCIGSREELIVQIMFFLMKWSYQSLQHGVIFQNLLEYYSQYIVDSNSNQDSIQIDSLQYELYLKLLRQFMSGDQDWIKNVIKNYPNLKKGVLSSNQNNLGKNRKFLQKKQYYIDKNSNINAEQQSLKTKQYTKFNLNYQILQNQSKQNPLLNMDDPLHKRLAMEPHYVNLLREQNQSQKKKGIYVQYQKKLTENEEQLLNKINSQVQRYNTSKQSSILHETALQKQLWYRKTKGQTVQSRKSKVNDAISKQIQKFIMFKREQKNQKDKQFYEEK